MRPSSRWVARFSTTVDRFDDLFRLFRVFRLLKLDKYYPGLTLIDDALREAADQVNRIELCL